MEGGNYARIDRQLLSAPLEVGSLHSALKRLESH